MIFGEIYTSEPRRNTLKTKKDVDITEESDTEKHGKVRFEKVLKNLYSKEHKSSKFLCDFNPLHDWKTKKVQWRPKRKVVETLMSKKDEDSTEELNTEKHSETLNSVSEKARLYDKKGVLHHSGLDLCDCLEDPCPGCHLPCSNCSSPKCGHVCRSGRYWQYNSVVLDGFPDSKVLNAHLVSVSP